MRKSTTILVVEPDRRVQYSVQLVLERAGYAYIAAESLHDALETTRRHSATLVVIPIDYMMPGGGWVLSSQMWEIAPEMPIVLVTEAEGKFSVPPGMKPGPYEVVAGPVIGDEFIAVVERLVGPYGGRRE